jgi:hypothetical protein
MKNSQLGAKAPQRIISTGKKHKNPGYVIIDCNIDCSLYRSALIYRELEVETAVKTTSNFLLDR